MISARALTDSSYACDNLRLSWAVIVCRANTHPHTVGRSLILGICHALLLCAPNLVRIRQIFLEIMSGNHLTYVVALNNLCDLENKVEVTRFEPDLHLAMVLLCTKFGQDTSIEPDLHLAMVLLCTKFGQDTSNIFQILSRNHLSHAMLP